MQRRYTEAVRRRHAALADRAYVAPSRLQSPGAGNGLFAARALRPGEVVAVYDGRLVDDATARAWSARRRSHVRTLLHRALHLDGLRRPPSGGRGLASFANDARAAGGNNARFRLTRALTPLCELVATRPIARGAEVLVSYGAGYWRKPHARCTSSASPIVT